MRGAISKNRMRHRKKKTTLDRNASSRKALLRALAASVILYEKVQTTEARAKAVRGMVERLVTRAKDKTLATRRRLMRVVPQDMVVRKLMEVLGPRYKTRPGGYTRITKLSLRSGDAARLAQIEFV